MPRVRGEVAVAVHRRGDRTADEVGELVHADRRTVMRWVRRKNLPRTKIGRRVLFTPDQVQAIIDAHRVLAQGSGRREWRPIDPGGLSGDPGPAPRPAPKPPARFPCPASPDGPQVSHRGRDHRAGVAPP